VDPITGFLINLIIGVVLSAASTLLKQAFSSPAEKQKKATGTRGSAQIGGKVSQYFLVGTVGEAGKLEYRNAWGNSGEVPNAYLTDVRSFGDMPLTALAGLFVNGVRHAIPTTGSVAQGYPVPTLSSKFWWKFLDGSQTTADSYLTGKFGSDADRAWTSDMIGRGVPVLITTALWDEKLWTGFPEIVGEFQGIKLYDPRKDSTAGGSGSQRWADPSTWAFSDNNLVVIYNIERGIYYDGVHIWGGKKTAADLPYAAWAAAMDACDLAITLAEGGTEKQFRCGRRIDLNERPADVIQEFLIGANARICHASDGTVYPLVGVPDEADGAFSDADVLGSEPLGSIPFPNLDEIINGATATYREPEQAWEDKETAPYYRSDLEEEDDGRRQVRGLDLGTTFSGTQAQRIIKAVIEEGRRFRTHVVVLPPEFAQFRPLQVLAWTSERFGYEAKLFLITARTRDPWGKVVFGLQEIDPADHDWNPETDQQPLSFAPVVTNRPAPQEVSGFYVEPAIALDSQGRERRPAIDAFWDSTSVTVDVRAVRITIALPDDGEPEEPGAIVWEGEAPRPELGSARLVQALLPDEDYLVQIEYQPRSGRATVASSWLPVKTPDVRFGALDIYEGAIVADLPDSLIEWQAYIGPGVREAVEELKRIGRLTAEQDLGNYKDKVALERRINSTYEASRAEYTELITAATGPDSAIVGRIETLEAEVGEDLAEAISLLSASISTVNGKTVANANAISSLRASMGGNSASVNVRYSASAGPSGYAARYVIQAAVNDGAYRGVGFYMDVPSNPSLPGRIVLQAQQTAIVDTAGNILALFTSDGKLATARIPSIATNMITAGAITTALLAADSVTAAKLNVTTLSAITANLGTVTAGLARSADNKLQVDFNNTRILVLD
jgi:hypothetical protein